MSYGFCPTCKAPGETRERRPNGNDRCVNGHVYPSRDALPEDPRTGLAVGYHGTAAQAIEYALDVAPQADECDLFLAAWREGGAFEEWPEFYEWLKEQK